MTASHQVGCSVVACGCCGNPWLYHGGVEGGPGVDHQHIASESEIGDGVVSTGDEELVVAGVSAEDVVADVANQGVVPEAPQQGVVAYRASQAHGLAGGTGVCAKAARERIGEAQIDAGALAEELCLTLVAGVGIGGPAGNHVGHRPGAGSDLECISAIGAQIREPCESGVDDEEIDAEAAGEAVIAATSVEAVPAAATDQRVVIDGTAQVHGRGVAVLNAVAAAAGGVAQVNVPAERLDSGRAVIAGACAAAPVVAHLCCEGGSCGQFEAVFLAEI